MSRFPHLLSPMKVGSHTYKNRVIAAPMYGSVFLTLTEVPEMFRILDHAMRARADGGCAQVTLGETPVNFREASREPCPPIDFNDYDDPSGAKLAGIASYVKSRGAKCLIELCHCGESVEKIPGVELGVGPMGYTRPDGMRIFAMDEAKMQEVIRDFVTAARFMREVGMDGVVVHSGHGWLLHQFLSARTNQRTDAYGGPLENRARFPLALLKALREEMGEDFILELRVSGDECMEGGMGIDETVAFCQLAQPYVDSIHMSIGVYRDPILSGEFSSLFHPHGLNADLAEAVKKSVSVPVIVVGGINDPELAEELIAQGKCDFVALARQLTADPDFVRKVEAGREWDIRPCLRCFKCFPGLLEGLELRDLPYLFGCSVNPTEFFYDAEFLERQPEGSRKVLVVGGGIAGMQAAITAHDRGHRVTLVEKADRLGGLLFFTETDNYKKDLHRFKDVMARGVRERAIEVRTDTEFTAADVATFGADAVILAVGSSPIVPAIKGIEHAIHAIDAYRDIGKIGQKVVIVGGGLVGCETGLNLAREGRDVTVIEMQDRVAPDSYAMHRIGLLAEMDKRVTVRVNTRCMEITPRGVKAVDEWGAETVLDADTVLFALGMRANRDEAEALRDALAGVEVHEVGDCVKAAKVYEAVRQGFVAAMSIY